MGWALCLRACGEFRHLFLPYLACRLPRPMHPFFRLSSLWLSSVLGLNQTRLFILFAHFLPLLLRVFLHSIPAASADQEEGHVAAYSLVKTMPCRRRRSPHSVPSPPPRSIPICTTRQRFTVIPLLMPHTHTAHPAAAATDHLPRHRTASEGGTDGWTLLCFFLGPLPAGHPPASLLLSSPLLSERRPDGSSPRLICISSSLHTAVAERTELGACLAPSSLPYPSSASCERKVIPTGAAAAAPFYLSLTSRYKASRFPAVSSPLSIAATTIWFLTTAAATYKRILFSHVPVLLCSILTMRCSMANEDDEAAAAAAPLVW